ncbi:MAG: sigma-54-dependent Fis family transcriptional regulator, partial [Deltaproteobacteria bacterium]|nr:sigma-54-dependent Fis family transcriptional regulator [Deltaproteobacteria bacterium]
MRNESILVVDDAPEIRFNISEILRREGFNTDIACDGQEAMDKCGKNFFDIVITDLDMPKKNGMEILYFLKEYFPETICIIITGFGTIQGAVEAIRQGAFDYLTKPVKLREVIIIVDKALKVRELKRENRSLKQELRDIHGFENIVGVSKAMQHVFKLVEKVAKVDSTVLITGESGTGKELIVHAIHYSSERRDKPFIPVNCAAIPGELLESELFGHEKGAFTHAVNTRIGRFELANKGTIFLDEIGDMSPVLQVKLLRFLQERQFERVGGTKTIHVDVRIIAATNTDLEEAFRKGSFRDDLYYRLNVIPIHIPPLKERPDDIPLLIQHFLLKFCSGKKIRVEGIEKDAIRCLESYDWPGNVRELEKERMVILADGPMLTIKDIPNGILKSSGKLAAGDLSEATLPADGLSLSSAVVNLEKTLILQALERTGWVKNRAAKLLQM